MMFEQYLQLKSPGTPKTCSIPRDARRFHRYTPIETFELAILLMCEDVSKWVDDERWGFKRGVLGGDSSQVGSQIAPETFAKEIRIVVNTLKSIFLFSTKQGARLGINKRRGE